MVNSSRKNEEYYDPGERFDSKRQKNTLDSELFSDESVREFKAVSSKRSTVPKFVGRFLDEVEK